MGFLKHCSQITLNGYSKAMAKLYLSQQRRSICRIILFGVILEFAIVAKCSSNKEMCSNKNKRNVSYLEANVTALNWTTAKQECNKQNLNLPVICNKDEQLALTNYLEGNENYSTIWTSGKKGVLQGWKWLDGRSYMEFVSPGPKEYNTHAALDQSRNYKAADPRHKNFYLCQYSGRSCTSQNVINVTNGCVRASDDDQTWYDARNQCFRNGGDLAILNDDDLVTLNRSKKLNARNSYWIGMQRNKWMWQQTANLDEEIKFTNWKTDTSLSMGECISINVSNGEWMPARCADRKKVVCERILDATESYTSSSTCTTIAIARSSAAIEDAMSSSATQSAMSTTSVIMMSSMSRSAVQDGIHSNSTADPQSQTMLYSAVSVVIAIIVICVIIVVLAIRYRRKSNKEIHRSENGQKLDDPMSYKSGNSQVDTPATASVADAGVYAEIPLARLSQSEEGAKPQSPEYACLDF